MYREPKDSVIVNRGSLAPNLTDIPDFPLPGTTWHGYTRSMYPHTPIYHHLHIHSYMYKVAREYLLVLENLGNGFEWVYVRGPILQLPISKTVRIFESMSMLYVFGTPLFFNFPFLNIPLF